MTTRKNSSKGSSKDLNEEKKELEQVSEPVAVAEPVTPAVAWIVGYDYKECPSCGARMQGWAFRQQFAYCPMCGVQLG